MADSGRRHQQDVRVRPTGHVFRDTPAQEPAHRTSATRTQQNRRRLELRFGRQYLVGRDTLPDPPLRFDTAGLQVVGEFHDPLDQQRSNARPRDVACRSADQTPFERALPSRTDDHEVGVHTLCESVDTPVRRSAHDVRLDLEPLALEEVPLSVERVARPPTHVAPRHSGRYVRARDGDEIERVDAVPVETPQTGPGPDRRLDCLRQVGRVHCAHISSSDGYGS